MNGSRTPGEGLRHDRRNKRTKKLFSEIPYIDVSKMVAKTDLELVVHDSPEDWGYDEPTRTDKWIV